MAIYTSSGGCSGPFTAVACNDNSCSFRAAITTTLNAGIIYSFVLWEAGNSPYTPGETSIQLRISGIFAPTAVTLPPVSITSTGAVLNAAVNPNSAGTTAWFDWGTSTNYANSTPPQSLGSGSSNVAFAANLTGLSGNLAYFFRVKATNVIGASPGTNRSFAWTSSRPLVNHPTVSTSGFFGLQFSGVVGQKYLVLSSTNLANWLLLGTAIDNGNGAFAYQDPNPARPPSRFYRVFLP